MDKNIEFKPYGDVYWDPNYRYYNIFGLEITPELLYEIANGMLDSGFGSYDFKHEDKGYTITRLTGLRAKFERLLEEPANDDIQGEKEFMEYMNKCFSEFVERGK